MVGWIQKNRPNKSKHPAIEGCKLKTNILNGKYVEAFGQPVEQKALNSKIQVRQDVLHASSAVDRSVHSPYFNPLCGPREEGQYFFQRK
jgi:hypothetical protein